MDKSMFNRNYKDFQLVSLGIELAHKVIGAMDCCPGLETNKHMVKALELARQWNETFFDVYVTTEGV